MLGTINENMNTETTPNIKKSNLDKLIEFFHAVRIIHDLRKLTVEGKYYLITPIYGQLRALLTDSTKRKEPKPLFEIADMLGEDIQIFYMPNTFEADLPELYTTVH